MHQNMTVLVALGTHRGQSEKELRQIASEEVYQKVKVVCHDCDGPLAYLGETSFGTPVWSTRWRWAARSSPSARRFTI